MKYIDEFQDPELARRLVEDIHATVTRPWALMEVCGGQTHSIIRHGIDQLLPDEVELIHGPGCPVCVTPLEVIDKALEIASRPEVIFCSFGDMLRVPGSGRDLFQVRGEGGDVRVVYSPLDALRLARENPGREVVFFGIGFETTAPPNAMTVHQARRLGIRNFSMLVSHVRVPPAIEAIMCSESCRVQGFLAAGHVCSVMGTGEYPALAERFGVPIVVTGFEPLDVLEGVRRAVRQLERGEHTVDNAYARVVPPEGNPAAKAMLADVFEVTDRSWRGIGVIPGSGWRLADRYREFDAEHRFRVSGIDTREPAECRSGEVLQGLLKPHECEAFGTVCTPRTPLGATMVSSEGACAAYYLYRRLGGGASGAGGAGDAGAGGAGGAATESAASVAAADSAASGAGSTRERDSSSSAVAGHRPVPEPAREPGAGPAPEPDHDPESRHAPEPEQAERAEHASVSPEGSPVV